MATAAAAYRGLLKAQRALFAGDLSARAAARAETRTRFLEHASAAAEDLPTLLEDANATAGFIRENVAQSILNERGNYEMKAKPEHIHTGTEPPPLPFDVNVNEGTGGGGCRGGGGGA